MIQIDGKFITYILFIHDSLYTRVLFIVNLILLIKILRTCREITRYYSNRTNLRVHTIGERRRIKGHNTKTPK